MKGAKYCVVYIFINQHFTIKVREKGKCDQGRKTVKQYYLCTRIIFALDLDLLLECMLTYIKSYMRTVHNEPTALLIGIMRSKYKITCLFYTIQNFEVAM